jgi:hypothetical protein
MRATRTGRTADVSASRTPRSRERDRVRRARRRGDVAHARCARCLGAGRDRRRLLRRRREPVRAEGEPARLTTTVAASGGVFVALAAAAHVAGTAVAFAADDIDAYRVDPNTARLFMALSFWFFVMSLFAAAAMALAASVLALRTGALPRWLAYAGLVGAAGGLLSIFAWPSLLVLAWIVAVSAWLLAPRAAEGY